MVDEILYKRVGVGVEYALCQFTAGALMMCGSNSSYESQALRSNWRRLYSLLNEDEKKRMRAELGKWKQNPKEMFLSHVDSYGLRDSLPDIDRILNTISENLKDLF